MVGSKKLHLSRETKNGKAYRLAPDRDNIRKRFSATHRLRVHEVCTRRQSSDRPPRLESGHKFLALCLVPMTRALTIGMLMAALSLLAADCLATGPQNLRVEGSVKDQSGAAVPNVEVVLRSGAFSATQTTDNTGRFEFDRVLAGTGSILVRAKGFSPLERKWTALRGTVSLELVLTPEPVAEKITVTATRTEVRLSDTAASVIVLSPEDLAATAALTLDDALRQVPAFALFRRSGSRTANPTSQGVSLRGVGASGASRALALRDNVPLNDPFGGWVYWDRIPRESIGGIEVLRGAASNLYGTDALGGVINLLPRRPADHRVLTVEALYGNERTPDLSLFTGGRTGRWGAQLAAEAFRSDGYIIVDALERGRVDTPAGSSHATADLTLDRSLSNQAQMFFRGSIFRESRQNGTPLQRNRTHFRQLVLGGDWRSERAGSFSARVYGGPQVFDQEFSAVAAGRDTETLTRSQRVPACQVGSTVQWSRPVGSRQTLVAGVDTREVRGASDELVFVGGRINSAVGAGGRERTEGVFGEDLLRFTPRWLVTVGARLDRWRNYDALQTTRPLTQTGPPAVIHFDDRTETALSPRLSVLRKLSDKVSLNASAYRSFRAPTLNELYRSFRVGDVVTLSNDKLRAERLTGGEAGVRFAGLGSKLDLRGTFFWSEITRPIANVTLSIIPGLITRERENLGRTGSRGVEVDANAHLTSHLDLSASYQFADAKVLRFPANTALEGLLVPQVPRNLFTFQASYSKPSRITLGAQGRFGGAEFDDDQNQLRLDRYFTLDALISRPVGHGVEVFAAGENLLNQRFVVGRTPIRTIGPPLLVRVGIRVQLGLP